MLINTFGVMCTNSVKSAIVHSYAIANIEILMQQGCIVRTEVDVLHHFPRQIVANREKADKNFRIHFFYMRSKCAVSCISSEIYVPMGGFNHKASPKCFVAIKHSPSRTVLRG